MRDEPDKHLDHRDGADVGLEERWAPEGDQQEAVRDRRKRRRPAFGDADDQCAELLTVLGVLAMAVIAGWVMKNPEAELRVGASPTFERLIPVARFLIRYVSPPLLAYVSWIALRQTIRVVAGG